MCDPVTLTVLAVGSLVATAAGGIAQADAQRKAGSYQAQVANNQAKMVEDAARVAEQNEREKTAQTISTQRANYAAAGIDPNFGSPTDVQASTAITGELNALTIRTNAANEAQGLREQGIAARQTGKSQATGTLLSTAGQVAGQAATFGLSGGFGAPASTTGAGMPGMKM